MCEFWTRENRNLLLPDIRPLIELSNRSGEPSWFAARVAFAPTYAENRIERLSVKNGPPEGCAERWAGSRKRRRKQSVRSGGRTFSAG